MNMLTLWSIILFLVGIILFAFAFSGIAIAVTTFTKILFILAFFAFIMAGLLFALHNKIKVKVQKPNEE